jgi:hypothetical protein
MQPREHHLLVATVLCGVLAMPAVYAQTALEAGAPRATSAESEETTSPARDSTAPAPMSFEELDANGDGAVGKDEAAVDPALAQAFDTLDKDADGKLSPAEYAAYNVAGGR